MVTHMWQKFCCDDFALKESTPRLKKAACFSAAFFAMILLVFWILYSSTFTYEYTIKAQQYVTINLPKNWGIRKTLLEYIDTLLSLRPMPAKVSFDRTQALAGVSQDPLKRTLSLPSTENILHVADSTTLVKALKNATAGQLILLAPGNYILRQRRIRVGHGGDPGFPITLAAEKPGQAEIQLDSLEGLYINKPHWVIKNLTFRGICSRHSACEHALHLTGHGDHILIENNRFIDFNAHLKSNGRRINGRLQFPDNVVVRHNDFYNTRIRESRKPASPIDVVGGNNWQITDNFIADFTRKVRGKPSVVYGAYLKGGGENGVISNNVINCAWRIPHQSVLDIRIALSLGDGGTGRRFCQSESCVYEHKGGVIKKNLLLNCSNDVAIYLNKAMNTRITDNVMLNTLGIDARFMISNVIVDNNVIQGRIKARDGAKVDSGDNKILRPAQKL